MQHGLYEAWAKGIPTLCTVKNVDITFAASSGIEPMSSFSISTYFPTIQPFVSYWEKNIRCTYSFVPITDGIFGV